jgi:hypothetical protein
MVLISARFLSLLLTALAAGVVVSHVMPRAGKITLPGPLFIAVQNTLYRSWGKKVGAVEIGAFLSTLTVTVLARGKGPIFALSLASLLCLVGMMLLWAVFINAINSESVHPRLNAYRQTGPCCVTVGIVCTQSARYSR